MAKQSKNLSKVQSMLDGTYGGKTIVGDASVGREQTRAIGDTWTDSDGNKWEQKEGYRYKIPSMPAVGMFNHQCKDCGKNCSPKMAKPWDRDVWKADGRCYHCQMNFELDLEIDSKLRWFAYRRLKDLINMEALEKDMEQWVEDMTRQRERNPFDETVANALANGEVSMQINKNKA